MSNTAVLIVDMSILVGIFLLGLLAKLFPRSGSNAGSKQRNLNRSLPGLKGPGMQ